MQDSTDIELKNLGDVKRIQVLTWDLQSIAVQALLSLCAGSAVELVELVPLHGNIAASKSVLDVTERSRYETYVRLDGREKLYRLEDCEMTRSETGESQGHPEYRVVLSGAPSPNLAKPAGITYLDKVWDWSDLFSNFTDALGLPLERSPDDLLVPKEFLVDGLRDSMGISDGMDAQIMIDEMVRVNLMEEVEFELYRLRYQDSRMFHCLNWSGRSEIETNTDISVDQLIPYLVALANRIQTIESREYIDLLNNLDLLRKCSWDSIIDLKNPKLLLDLHYVMMRQLHFSDQSYERKRHSKFFYEFDGKRIIYPDSIRNCLRSLTTQHQSSNDVLYDILCELRWTLTGVDELDKQIINIACNSFCLRTVKLDTENVMHIPTLLRPVLDASPFHEILKNKISTARKISFYDLVISVL